MAQRKARGGSLSASRLNSSSTGTDVEVVDVLSDEVDANDEDEVTASKNCGTTLVIAPLSLVF
jgi:hypothetical protein